jgi:predicted RND superfamily exporter protein
MIGVGLPGASFYWFLAAQLPLLAVLLKLSAWALQSTGLTEINKVPGFLVLLGVATAVAFTWILLPVSMRQRPWICAAFLWFLCHAAMAGRAESGLRFAASAASSLAVAVLALLGLIAAFHVFLVLAVGSH